jgi:glycerol-3-phosphate O-acyltransferase/dihydroxyacetone phosphate acyltransferase
MPDSHSRVWFTKIWRLFCRSVVRVLYRSVEVTGTGLIPTSGGLVLCANHVNALVDGVLLQASTSRNIRPLARSGLFLHPLLEPLLRLIGAVPIYRRTDKAADEARNDAAFARCSELLGEGETIVIFPEGQSHSDPHIHKLKTGAARIVIAAEACNGIAPTILPVGLTFTRKGKFRSDVLVQFGAPVDCELSNNLEPFACVELLTERITAGLARVTLNADSWEDLYLVNRLERFFALRHCHYRKGQLRQRFRALQRLIDAQRLLRLYEPDKVRAIAAQLKAFERLCKICGIRDYHLTVELRPVLAMLYLGRIILDVLIVLPIAIWGVINSIVPFGLTRHLTPRIAHGVDQYDTTKLLLGMLLFISFWSIQTVIVYQFLGMWWALGYLVSVLIAAPFALRLRSEYKIVLNNLRTFFMFLRKKQLKEHLADKRREIEVELARLVRIVKRLPSGKNSSAVVQEQASQL